MQESGTQVRKNEVLTRHIDMTGINKVPTLDKCPLDKSPPGSFAVLEDDISNFLIFLSFYHFTFRQPHEFLIHDRF